jgi:hypothetical protein
MRGFRDVKSRSFRADKLRKTIALREQKNSGLMNIAYSQSRFCQEARAGFFLQNYPQPAQFGEFDADPSRHLKQFRTLPAMQQGEKPKLRQRRSFFMSENAKNGAFFSKLV